MSEANANRESSDERGVFFGEFNMQKGDAFKWYPAQYVKEFDKEVKIDLEVKLIKEEFHGAKLDKYKIPTNFIQEDFGFYYIHLKTNNMTRLRYNLYQIPVRMLCSDPNDQRYTQSYREVPEGMCFIDQFPGISNNFHLAIPSKKDKDLVNITMQNKDKSDEIVSYPIIYNYQFIGYLNPNSYLNESYIVKDVVHPGIHATYGFYRRGLPNDEVIIYSLQPWKEIEKKLSRE